MQYLGTCGVCGRANEYRRPVLYNGKKTLVCDAHGASTRAQYDIMNDERRARVHGRRNSYSVSYIVKVPVGAWMASMRGRREFRKLETAIRYARKFVER